MVVITAVSNWDSRIFHRLKRSVVYLLLSESGLLNIVRLEPSRPRFLFKPLVNRVVFIRRKLFLSFWHLVSSDPFSKRAAQRGTTRHGWTRFPPCSHQLDETQIKITFSNTVFTVAVETHHP